MASNDTGSSTQDGTQGGAGIINIDRLFTLDGWVTGEGFPACYVNWEIVKEGGGKGNACDFDEYSGMIFFLNMFIYYWVLQTFIRLFTNNTQ